MVAWAKEQVEKRQAEIDVGPFRAPEPAAAKGGGMGDEDFMAALSRAFAESEQQRATAAHVLGGDDESAEGGEAAAEEPHREGNE